MKKKLKTSPEVRERDCRLICNCEFAVKKSTYGRQQQQQ